MHLAAAVKGLLDGFDKIVFTGLQAWSSRPQDAEEGGELGAVALEMAGACWVLPEFYGRVSDDDMITTFKSHVTRQLADPLLEAKDRDLVEATRELWAAGGPTSTIALKTIGRMQQCATDEEGLLAEWLLSSFAQRLAAVLVAPPSAPASAPCGPASLKAALATVVDVGSIRKHEQSYKDSFVHEVDRGVWGGEQECASLVRLISLITKTRAAPPAWLSEWRPLVTYQHGDLNLANVLVDAQGSLWLIDFAKSAKKNPFTDAAFFLSRLLFQHFPIPPTLDDVKRTVLKNAEGHAQPNLLVDVMELSVDDANELQRLVAACTTKAQLMDKVVPGSPLKQVLHRIADDEVHSERCLAEACKVFDALFPASSELWDTRKPPEGLSAAAKLVFDLCAQVLKLSCSLVSRCSRKANADDADLHASSFVMPLLSNALASLRYPQLSRWHKQLAWHVATSLAEQLCVAIQREPTLPPESDDAVRGTFDLATGQRVRLLLDTKGRLEGGEGRVTHWRVGAAGEKAASDALGGTLSDPELSFDGCSQVVLPWSTPSAGVEEAIGAAVADVQQGWEELPTLVSQIETATRSAGGADRQAGQRLSAYAQALERLEGRPSSVLSNLVAKLSAEVKAELEAMAEFEAMALGGGSSLMYTRYSLEWEFTSLALQTLRAALRKAGSAGLRVYAAGQRLAVNLDGAWIDARVLEAVNAYGQHRLEAGDREVALALHPWNHAPSEMPTAELDAVRARHARSMRAQHASVIDGLSGKRLDVFDQCVPIEVTASDDG